MNQPSTIPTNKRIQLLDIHRGFALFGILLVNANDYRMAPFPTDPKFSELNIWANNFVIAIGEGSFFPLFSMLFGIGFAIWMDKSMKTNGGALRFAWRSFILLILAFLFYMFVEDRNVLIRYAIWSIPLLLFYRASPKILLIASIIFMLLAVFYDPIYKQFNKPDTATSSVQLSAFQKANIDAEKIAKENPTYLNFVKARMTEIPEQIKMCVTFHHYTFPIIFSMFLLGAFFWRTKLLTDLEKHKAIWSKIFWWGLLLGGGGNIFVFVERILAFKRVLRPNREIMGYIESIADPLLTLFYISLFVMVINNRRGKSTKIFDVLASTGRIPLTNYFIQYIIMSIIMWPYGFDYDGKLYSQQLILITITVFICQVIFSVFWTKRFIYGPMEWLWRSVTYFKWQPIKRRT